MVNFGFFVTEFEIGQTESQTSAPIKTAEFEAGTKNQLFWVDKTILMILDWRKF